VCCAAIAAGEGQPRRRRDSQHMNGNATDIPGVPVLKVRQVRVSSA